MMKKNLLLLSLGLGLSGLLQAQSLGTVTGLKLYEHHSPAIAGGQGANGTQSGYDFVNRAYFHSYNASNMGAYQNGEEANIDMVEDKGPYGGNKKFGFTSGVSAIWNGDIKGNGLTLWMEAPANFNYATAAQVSDIANAFSATTATQSIAEVKANTVYLARIRNTQLYVAMKVSNVSNKATGVNDVFFDFEYKYGALAATGLNEVNSHIALNIYPNPAVNQLAVENTLQQPVSARILSVNGQEMQAFDLTTNGAKSVDVSGLGKGMYFIQCTAQDGRRFVHKFVKG
jgi:hypothetical protein